MSTATRARATLVIDAKPGRVFDVLATPHRLPDIDPFGETISDDNTAPVTAAGQVFRMNMVELHGEKPVSYHADHRVDAFEHNRLIGWTATPVDGPHAGPTGGWSWRWELTRRDGKRTEVTVTYDWAPEDAANGAHEHSEADLEACLARLAIEVKK